MKNVGTEARLPGLRSGSLSFTTVTRPSHFNCLCLSSLICKMGLIIVQGIGQLRGLNVLAQPIAVRGKHPHSAWYRVTPFPTVPLLC